MAEEGVLTEPTGARGQALGRQEPSRLLGAKREEARRQPSRNWHNLPRATGCRSGWLCRGLVGVLSLRETAREPRRALLLGILVEGGSRPRAPPTTSCIHPGWEHTPARRQGAAGEEKDVDTRLLQVHALRASM